MREGFRGTDRYVHQEPGLCLLRSWSRGGTCRQRIAQQKKIKTTALLVMSDHFDRVRKKKTRQKRTQKGSQPLGNRGEKKRVAEVYERMMIIHPKKKKSREMCSTAAANKA